MHMNILSLFSKMQNKPFQKNEKGYAKFQNNRNIQK